MAIVFITHFIWTLPQLSSVLPSSHTEVVCVVESQTQTFSVLIYTLDGHLFTKPQFVSRWFQIKPDAHATRGDGLSGSRQMLLSLYHIRSPLLELDKEESSCRCLPFYSFITVILRCIHVRLAACSCFILEIFTCIQRIILMSMCVFPIWCFYK